jgi:hypothetical protein
MSGCPTINQLLADTMTLGLPTFVVTYLGAGREIAQSARQHPLQTRRPGPPNRGSTRVQALTRAAPQLTHCGGANRCGRVATPLALTLELVPVFPNRVQSGR